MALASAVGSFVLDRLMWALQQFGVTFTPVETKLAACAVILLAVVSALLWGHLFWRWAHSKGWGKAVGVVIIALGVAVFCIGAFVLYWEGEHPVTVAKQLPHALPKPPPIDAPSPLPRPEPPQAAQAQAMAAREIEPRNGNAKLANLQPEFVAAGADAPPGTQALRVNYRNMGSNQAGSPAAAAMSFIGDALPPDADITTHTIEAAKAAYSPDIFDKNRPEVDTDQTFYKWAPGVFLSAENFQAVKEGKKTFVVFFAMTYTDSTLKPHQYWELTYTFSYKGSVTERTILRNRTVMREAPK